MWEELRGPATEVDILLVVDNSPSMADKQAVLAQTIPDLVTALPDADVHIGVISSSLGALTAAVCDLGPAGEPTQNESAHLLTRTASGSAPSTLEGKEFLGWPASTSTAEKAPIGGSLADMVLGVGEMGCGYEMPLEAMVRFLVDPNPYDSLHQADDGRLQRDGTDQVVLHARADFLRPDSVVVVLLLSDENDCSVDVGGQGYAALNPQPFFRSTSVCAYDPNHPCCTSCALATPSGCDPDPTCGAQGTSSAATYTFLEDHPGITCFDQKRRYGTSLLYPVARYANALTKTEIDPTRADYAAVGAGAAPNPLLAERTQRRVIFAGIVGVPWQAVARGCPEGESCPGAAPDLAFGLKRAADHAGAKTLDALGGDPDGNVPPTELFMKESVDVRIGTSELTGASLPGDNPINGYDRDNDERDGLQYACTYPLSEPKPGSTVCDGCADASCETPVCAGSTQIAAGATPGLRHVALVRAMGEEGVLGSICPSCAPKKSKCPARPARWSRSPAEAILKRVPQEHAELAVGHDVGVVVAAEPIVGIDAELEGAAVRIAELSERVGDERLAASAPMRPGHAEDVRRRVSLPNRPEEGDVVGDERRLVEGRREIVRPQVDDNSVSRKVGRAPGRIGAIGQGPRVEHRHGLVEVAAVVLVDALAGVTDEVRGGVQIARRVHRVGRERRLGVAGEVAGRVRPLDAVAASERVADELDAVRIGPRARDDRSAVDLEPHERERAEEPLVASDDFDRVLAGADIGRELVELLAARRLEAPDAGAVEHDLEPDVGPTGEPRRDR